MDMDSLLASFADQYPGVVYYFNQTELWLDESGQGSNLIPGTTVNGYIDEHHLNPEGAKYLAPYLCAALQEWGAL